VRGIPETPVRILVIATAHGTLGSFFGRQLHLLAENGFEVHAVSSPGEGLDQLSRLGTVTTHPIAMARKPDPLHDLVSLVRIWLLIRKLRPHIVHSHTPKAGLLGMMGARAAGVPVRLYTLHGLPLMTRTGWFRRLLAAAEQLSCGLSSRTYSVSRSLESLALDLGLCPPAKLTTLGDGSCAGVDCERFSPGVDGAARGASIRSAYGIPQGSRVLCFVGRVARDKGVEALAAAWRELAREFPSLHLLVCGAYDATDPVPERVLDELRGHARAHVTGDWAPDVPAVYAASDICVLPTLREGLSQVALEAGAMGIPIVSTRVTGLVNSVRDGVTGLLVRPGDASELTAAIRRLLLDEPLRRRMGKAGREHVRGRFSDETVNLLWLSEYKKLTGQSATTLARNQLAGVR